MLDMIRDQVDLRDEFNETCTIIKGRGYVPLTPPVPANVWRDDDEERKSEGK